MKKIFYNDEARDKVLSGAKQLYDAVKVTFGPKGKNVVIEKSYGAPTITHDGVTVAEAVDLGSTEDNLGEQIGAKLIQTAAQKLNKVAGDGTTTVTVLTYNILSEANKLIAAGVNPMELRKGIEKAGAKIVKEIDEKAEKIAGNDQKVAEVATISAGDSEIGKMIADVISKIGQDGVVTVEAGQGLEMEQEIVEGFTYDKGYSSPFFVTDVNRQEAIFDKPSIFITTEKISSSTDIVPILEQVVQSGKKDLVIIAEEVEGEALSLLVLNKLKGVFNSLVLKAPSFGDRRKEIMEDIAVLTDATVVSTEKGMKLSEVGLEVLGQANKVIATKDETTIIKGAGSKEAVKDRIDLIHSQANVATSDYEKEQFDKRAAALSGKVAVIIGGDEDYQPESFEFAYEQLARGDALVALDPPSDVWLRPKTELAALLDKLEKNGVHNDRDVTDDETTRSSIGIRKFVERITLSNGGSITLVRGRYSYDNSTVPKPEGKLLMLDQENISALLQEINSLLQRAQ